jgi:hypothetical protein
MRLSEWRARAPHKDAKSPRIAAIVDPILASVGAGTDPHCWVAWGEEPGIRHTILVPTDPGLVSCFVRVVPGEGPRATAKLVRWNRVSIGELAIEAQGGHRLVSFQAEQQVLRGVDAEADRVAAFALRVIAAIDGRPLPPVEARSSRASRSRAGAAKPASRTASKAASSKASAPKASATKALAARASDARSH